MKEYKITAALTVDHDAVIQVGHVVNKGTVYLSELLEVPGHYGIWVTFNVDPIYFGLITKSGTVFIIHHDVKELSAEMFPFSYPSQFEGNIKEMLAPFLPGLFKDFHKAETV